MSDGWRELAAPVVDVEPPLDLWARVLQREAQLAPARPPSRFPRRGLAIALAAVACIAVIGLLALAAHSRSSAPAPANANPDAPILGPGTNGWVAVDGYRNDQIYLVRPGEKARPLEVAGSAGATATCPSWSPDGTKLLFGRVAGASQTGGDQVPRLDQGLRAAEGAGDAQSAGDAELVIVPVSLDGTTGAAKVIALHGFETGYTAPCGMWSPDGRWIALAGPAAVWVVDTQTEAIRRVPGLPGDLEWRPGTDDLAIASTMAMEPVTIYSTVTGKLSRLGEVKAAHITWSPDGKTLAYTGGEADARGLWLVDADGSNKRLLVSDMGSANHGIGPVWSPAGDRIAYQRLTQGEEHEVVLVNVADGTQRTIAPLVATSKQFRVDRSENFHWYPWAVWWAPDGTTLLYAAWNDGILGASAEVTALIAVPADRPHHATILIDGGNGGHQWPIQLWGRQPE